MVRDAERAPCQHRIRSGQRAPLCLLAPGQEIKTLGDDHVSSGTTDAMEWLDKELSKAYEIKTQKVGLSDVYKNEGKFLNRVLRCTEDGWEMEADPRNAELVMEQLGLKDDKGIGTPGLSGAHEDDNPNDDVPLTGADISSYKGVIVRCRYLASDRPDCNFMIKEGCRGMSTPTTGSLRRFNRIGRYLKANPRARVEVPDAEPTARGHRQNRCFRRARKSTSGGSISIGDHCITTWLKTQAVIAKSSAEPEVYGVVPGACAG